MKASYEDRREFVEIKGAQQDRKRRHAAEVKLITEIRYLKALRRAMKLEEVIGKMNFK